jgi:hypothetical protein
MASNLKFLDYTFLIDAENSFSHLYEFEKTLADFFASRGLQAENIKSVEGSLAKRLMFITKRQDGAMIPAQMEEKKPSGRPIMLKTKIRQLADRKLRAPAIKFMKGK